MPDSPTHAKSALRAALRAGRRSLTDAERADAASDLRARLDELVTARRARSISCYLSTASEPGTHDFVAGAAERGIRVLLPVTREDGLLDWSTPADHTVLGPHGVPEPDGERHPSEAVSEVDLMIVPAAAVDQDGVRLGWGRGFFDKTLAALRQRPPIYAVVYDNEVVDALPHEPHDHPVDGVVTPARTLTFTHLL